MTNNAVLIQCATGEHKRLLSLTSHLHKQYCDRHGIDYWVPEDADLPDLGGRRDNWLRVPLMAAAVANEYEYVFWLDADTLIVGDEDLRNACPETGFHLTWHDMSRFHSPEVYDHYCTGAIYLHREAGTEAKLSQWWDTSDDDHGWADQHAFNKLVREGVIWPDRLNPRWHSIVPHFTAPNPVVMAWHGFGGVQDRYEAMSAEIQQRAPQPVTVLGEPLSAFESRSERFRKAHEADEAGDTNTAELEYRAILMDRPDEPEVLRELGQVVAQKGDLKEAERLLRLSLAYETNVGGTWTMLGAVLGFQGRFAEELECYEMAFRYAPNMHSAHYNRATLLMRMGDYRNGFAEVHRWGKVGRFRRYRFPDDTLWNGEEVGTLLVYSDEGAGDVFMWMRFLKPLRERFPHMRIVWEVHDGLVELVYEQGMADTVIKLQLDSGMPYRFEAHIGLSDLALKLGLFEPEQITIAEPYIRPNAALVDRWKAQVTGEGLKVGLVWRGNSKHKNDHNRSMSLEDLRPILSVKGCTFYSLQFGTTVEGDHIRNLPLRSWHDTAAVIEHLDIVIAVDTGVCHLAGALGQRVITLLPFSGDWRWGIDGDETPWYPSMTLARQSSIGDWMGPVCSTAAFLEGATNAK